MKPLIVTVSIAALATCIAARLSAQGTVTIDVAGTTTPVARGFAGFSIEMSNVGTWAGTYDPASPAQFDSSLVNFLNLLGSYEGPPVVRIGGNSQDRTWLQTETATSPPAFTYTATPTLNTLTLDEVDGLSWVQRFTGAPFTIGLNMGGNLPSEAVSEMIAFQGFFDTGGIMAFDVGNEPDESDFTSYRPSGWGPSAYQTNLLTFLAALKAALPGATYAAPAVGGTSWLPPSATTSFNSLLGATNGQIAFVTAHRYIANGASPPSDPIGDLFQPSNSSAIAANYTATQAAAKSFGLGVRINETNTFYNGGLAGVSDAMASALWVSDVLGSYAQAGILGVNFHGGSSGPYSPFTMTASAGGIQVAANPVYYGMMLFSQFIQNNAGLLTATTAGSFPTTASLYASRDQAGTIRVLLINKSLTTTLTAPVTVLNLSSNYSSSGSLILLQAPSISSTTGLTLGGQSYDTNGNVVGTLATSTVPVVSGAFSMQIPPGSAGLFALNQLSPPVPTATAQAIATTVGLGSPGVFTASVSGVAPFRFQWLFNGAAISGATAFRFVLPSAQANNVGSYSVQVTNPSGSVVSNSVVLTVVPLPTITGQPMSQIVTSGTSTSFSVTATGSGTLTYQWYLNGTAIPGATSAMYTINSAASSNAGSYTVMVSNSAGSITSSSAALTVNSPPMQPASSGGGGGAPSQWFYAAFVFLGLIRLCRRDNAAEKAPWLSTP